MEDRERLRASLMMEYRKPVFFVSELIYCPYYSTGAPRSIVEEKRNEGIEVHRRIQSYLLRRFDHYEAEKLLVLDRGDYVLVGHADLVNHREKLVIEIKPHLGNDVRHIYQLSAYVKMYNTIYNRNYYGAFMVYRVRRDMAGNIISINYQVVKPFYLIDYILDILDKIAMVKMGKGDIRIATMTCHRCIRRGGCRPDVELKHNNGFVEVVIPDEEKNGTE